MEVNKEFMLQSTLQAWFLSTYRVLYMMYFLVLPTGKTLQAAQTVSDGDVHIYKLVPIGTNLNWLMQYFRTIASAVSDKLKMVEL